MKEGKSQLSTRLNMMKLTSMSKRKWKTRSSNKFWNMFTLKMMTVLYTGDMSRQMELSMDLAAINSLLVRRSSLASMENGLMESFQDTEKHTIRKDRSMLESSWKERSTEKAHSTTLTAQFTQATMLWIRSMDKVSISGLMAQDTRVTIVVTRNMERESFFLLTEAPTKVSSKTI